MDLKRVENELNTYVRPSTFPLAIKACQSADEIPENARRPQRDLGIKAPICQVMGLARKYGWVMAVTRDDIFCSGLIVLGCHRPTDFSPPDFYDAGKLCSGAFYTASDEAGARTEKETMKFDYGEYPAFVISPLFRAAFEPDIIVVYGDPAQIARLVVGALFNSGGTLSTTFSGRLGCSQLIVHPIKTGQCTFTLPGYGERMVAGTQDHEMAFAIPKGKVDDVLEGLKGTHAGGLRYPFPTYLTYQAQTIPLYTEFFGSLKETD